MSTLTSPHLRVYPSLGKQVPSGAFYQVDEDCLNVQIGRFESGMRYFSALESESIRFECDKKGRLIFLDLNLPRKRWRVVAPMCPPKTDIETADIRFLDFRSQISEPEIICDSSSRNLCLRFLRESARTCRLADNLLCEISPAKTLAAVWILNIVDDTAGRELASFRRRISEH